MHDLSARWDSPSYRSGFVEGWGSSGGGAEEVCGGF